MALPAILKHRKQQTLDELLADFEFMPGWHFSRAAEDERGIEGDWLHIEFGGIDVRLPHRSVIINSWWQVPADCDDLQEWLRGRIKWTVCHEVDEHFKVGGMRPYDPHLRFMSFEDPGF